jgi:SsrA-binding protein
MAVEVKNRKAHFRYFLIEEFTAGMILTGSEIKSIRGGKANIAEAYCKIQGRHLVIINMSISTYANAGYAQHEERRIRKLLLNQTEIDRIKRKLKDAGITIVPLRLYISKSGWAKLEIALAKGKNVGDKRADVKEKDLKREADRAKLR